MIPPSKFGKRLKELRQEKELSQRELSEQTGISKSTIGRWELGLEPAFPYVIHIAKFFDVSLDYLAGLSEY